MAGEPATDLHTEADVPRADVYSAVCDALAEVATDIDVTSLDPDSDLYDEAGLDSMDLLDLAVGIRDRVGVEIAERDYPKLTSVNAIVAHVQSLTN